MASLPATLTTPEQEAREFWTQAGTACVPPAYVMTQYFGLLQQYGSDLDTFDAKITQLLTNLGYGTNSEALASQLGAGAGETLGYWGGLYCLFDSEGHRFDLLVSRDGASLSIPTSLIDLSSATTSDQLLAMSQISNATFAGGKLTLSNAQFAFVLNFALPFSESDLDQPAIQPQDFAKATQPLCIGTVTLGSGAAHRTLDLKGKRGSYTPEGVKQAADGDPASSWYGKYMVVDVGNVNAIAQSPDPVQIYADADGLEFGWGDNILGDNAVIQNNVLTCSDDSDQSILYVLNFSASQSGAKQFEMIVTRTGTTGGSDTRLCRGYWLDDLASPTPTLLAHRSLLDSQEKNTLQLGDETHSQSIDFAKLKSGNVSNAVTMPIGVVGSAYAVTINLVNCVSTDSFAWQTQPDAGKGTSDPTTRASLVTSGTGTGQTVMFAFPAFAATDEGKLAVTLKLTQTSGSNKTVYVIGLSIRVEKMAAITLAPTALPPFTIKTEYTITLVGHGALGSFNWDASTSTLPAGLSFDADSKVLSGTVTDASLIGTPFALGLKLSAAAGIVMDPGVFTLPITLQPAAVTAKNPPDYSKIVLGAVGGIALLALAAVIRNKWKESQAKEKEKDVVEDSNKAITDNLPGGPEAITASAIKATKDALGDSTDSIATLRQQSEDAAKAYDKAMTTISTKLGAFEKLAKYLENKSGPDSEKADGDYADKTLGELREEVISLEKQASEILKSLDDLAKSVQETKSKVDKKTADTSNDHASSENMERFEEK